MTKNNHRDGTISHDNCTEAVNTSIRIGIIVGLLMGVDREACEHILKNRDGDFRFNKEATLVLEMKRKYEMVA